MLNFYFFFAMIDIVLEGGETVMAKEAKKTQDKKNLKEENKKVEVQVKEERQEKVKKVKEKRNNEKFNSLLKKVDDNRYLIILFIVGFLIATLLFRCILWPDRIATLKDGTQPVATLNGKNITADDLYTSMKKYYSVNILLNDIDDMLLSEKYPSDDEMEKSIKDTAEYYYTTYEKSYGYSKEEFLSQYGFNNEKEFLDNLRLDYRKNKYYEEYALSLVTDKEVQKYYNDEVFGDVDSKHILVSIAKDGEEGLSDEEAKKLANEIIGKLNKGTSWDDVVKEYKDKIITEDLGYNAFNASLEASYLKECKDLKTGEYSKKPVLTSYGYHIVFKKAQKEKPKLDEVIDDIKEVLATEKKNKDTNLYYKALINMRDEANLKFSDTKLAEEYKKYINNYK